MIGFRLLKDEIATAFLRWGRNDKLFAEKAGALLRRAPAKIELEPYLNIAPEGNL